MSTRLAGSPYHPKEQYMSWLDQTLLIITDLDLYPLIIPFTG
ncbi:hypothetical protein [Streptomyces sp. NBC_01237]|nr:hypothetical protein [Streptomyces sp. NBC_01237]WRZ76504.1 hypothetical protein OG251_35550 [Streptomyces sp. NBC_01237]